MPIALTRRIREKEGFTLIELIIVVIIIGVLAAIAIPSYTRTMEKAKGEEAIANLRLIFAGERMYRLHNNIYSSNLVTGPGPDDGGLYPDYIEDVTTSAREKYFTFTLETDDLHQTFTAAATRKSGIYDDEWIKIKQDENITTSDGWPFSY